MAEGLTNELLFETVVVAALAFWLACRDLPFVLAALIVLLRLSIPLVYFAWFRDGSWTVLDDLKYFAFGAQILEEGFNPLTAVLTDEGYVHLQTLSEGNHILYCWWNVLAQYLFGQHYYAPVFLNVLITFLTAAVLRRTTTLLGFDRSYGVAIQAFYLLHWEVISWSSLLNIKDPIVQALTATALYCVARFFQRRDIYSILGFAAVYPVFSLIRYYLPLLILLAAGLWMIWQWKSRIKYLMTPLAALVGYWALPMIEERSGDLNPASAVDGAARMLLTPLPWSITDEYTFLFISSVLHLIFLLPAAVGFIGLWCNQRLTRLYLIYLVLIIVLYALTEDLLGPRHRFQIAFIFVWIQFHFIWMLWSDRRVSTNAMTTLPTTTRQAPRMATRPVGAWA